jgi:hypothetical protein
MLQGDSSATQFMERSYIFGQLKSTYDFNSRIYLKIDSLYSIIDDIPMIQPLRREDLE